MKNRLLLITLFSVQFAAFAGANDETPLNGVTDSSAPGSRTMNGPRNIMQTRHNAKTIRPLPGRAGAVGGIESITIDGKRFYFGFDFSNDLVVSPLIEDVDTIAAFASQHMRQRDGSHEASYWRELAVESIEISGLSDDEGSRDFTSDVMRKIVGDLEAARIQNSRIPDFSVEYHMLYLLGAAAGWPDAFDVADIRNALTKLKIDPHEPGEDYFDESIAILNGSRALPAGSSYSDAAFVIQKSLDITVNMAPANWGVIFAPLTSN